MPATSQSAISTAVSAVMYCPPCAPAKMPAVRMRSNAASMFSGSCPTSMRANDRISGTFPCAASVDSPCPTMPWSVYTRT